MTAQELATDWLDAWLACGSRNGPAFVVTVAEHPRFIGVVSMAKHDDEAVGISYGVAPRWRGRGLASHAARLAALWASCQPDVRRVEARISQGDRASERVAVHAGFELQILSRPRWATSRQRLTCFMS